MQIVKVDAAPRFVLLLGRRSFRTSGNFACTAEDVPHLLGFVCFARLVALLSSLLQMILLSLSLFFYSNNFYKDCSALNLILLFSFFFRSSTDSSAVELFRHRAVDCAASCVGRLSEFGASNPQAFRHQVPIPAGASEQPWCPPASSGEGRQKPRGGTAHSAQLS